MLNDEEESNAKFGVNEAIDAGGRGQRARQRQQRRLAGTYAFSGELTLDRNPLCL